MVQQLAYSLAHANEYFNRIPVINQPIVIQVAVGTNYFFEIAKLRALRLLFNLVAKEYNHDLECHLLVSPTKRNKTSMIITSTCYVLRRNVCRQS
jgi:methylmalonyl-CoA mutase